MRWRIYQERFRGPGRYEFDVEGRKFAVHVDKDGLFDVTEEPPIPLYAFAALAGSARDQWSKP